MSDVIEEYERKAVLFVLIGMVRNGEISTAEAASRYGVSEEEFANIANAALSGD